MQKCRNNPKMQKQKHLKQKKKNGKFKNREYSVFKTQYLRNQEQIVIILKTFTYFIHIIVNFNSITMKCIICKRFKNYDFLLWISQMPRFKHCIFFIIQLFIFLFLLSIFSTERFLKTRYSLHCISGYLAVTGIVDLLDEPVQWIPCCNGYRRPP